MPNSLAFKRIRCLFNSKARAVAASKGREKKQRTTNKCYNAIQYNTNASINTRWHNSIRFESIRCLNCWSPTFFNRRAGVSVYITSIKCVCILILDARLFVSEHGMMIYDLIARPAEDCSSNWTSMVQRQRFFCLLIRLSVLQYRWAFILNSCAVCIFQCVSNTILHPIYFSDFFIPVRADVSLCAHCSLLRNNRIKYTLCVVLCCMIQSYLQWRAKKLFEMTWRAFGWNFLHTHTYTPTQSKNFVLNCWITFVAWLLHLSNVLSR